MPAVRESGFILVSPIIYSCHVLEGYNVGSDPQDLSSLSSAIAS